MRKRQTSTTEAEESRSAVRAKPARARLLLRNETTSAATPTPPFQAIVKNERRSADARSEARTAPD